VLDSVDDAEEALLEDPREDPWEDPREDPWDDPREDEESALLIEGSETFAAVTGSDDAGTAAAPPPYRAEAATTVSSSDHVPFPGTAASSASRLFWAPSLACVARCCKARMAIPMIMTTMTAPNPAYMMNASRSSSTSDDVLATAVGVLACVPPTVVVCPLLDAHDHTDELVGAAVPAFDPAACVLVVSDDLAVLASASAVSGTDDDVGDELDSTDPVIDDGSARGA